MPDAGTYAGITLLGLPCVGTYLMPGAIVARLENDGRLATPDGLALAPDTAALITDLSGAIDLVPAPIEAP